MSALLALALAAGAASADEARLVVLHTTDLHGSLTGWDFLADRPAPRGLVKLATLIKSVRAEGAPVLLVDDGDCIQGGPLVTVYQKGDHIRPEPMTTAMARLGYDAMAVGNHEFSFGPSVLERTRAAAGFPWLAANVVRASDGQPAFGASIVKTLGAVRVAVVGVTTPAVPALEDSANIAGLRFLSPVDAANAEIARLRAAKACDFVVLLAHTGLEKDPVTGVARAGDAPDENWGVRLAEQVKGADLLVLGHTHVVVPSATVNGLLVTEAGTRGENLGRVDVTLRRDGPAAPWAVSQERARMIAVTDSTADDPDLAAFAHPYERETRDALNQVLGQATVVIDAPRGRLAPSPLWALVHRTMLEVSGADVSLAPLFDPAARIAKGPVTLRDAMRLYPYDNTLVTVSLTGAQLKAALEQSARYLAPYTFEAGAPLVDAAVPGYQFDMAEGVSYTIDLTKPVGERIGPLTFRGAPLDPAATLKVAVTSYRANGGGGFEMIRTAPRLAVGHTEIRTLLADVILNTHELHGAWRNGWHVIPEYAATPERPLLDLLVRRGVLPRAEALALASDSLARRGETAAWVSRAFGARAGGAPAPAGPAGAPATQAWLADALVAAAKRAGYELRTADEVASFRRSLLTGTGAEAGAPLTRGLALAMVANARFPQVRVLETTDFHGAILPVARERRTQRAIGGSAVLAAWIERLRAENPEGTVLLDGGDEYQGTMISNLQYGRPVVQQMNALHYTAMAVGNHDFDWSADTLWRRVGEMRFAALGANMIEKKTGRRPRLVRADTVFARRGVRIGLLGLCYVGTPSVTLPTNVAHLRFEDDSTWAARLVPELRKKDRAAVVIGLGHTPAETDSTRRARGDLARVAHVPGADAWFGGHSHNQVLDEIGGAPVIIAGSQGQVVGVVDLVVDPLAGKVVEHRARLVTTYADEVKPDTAWLARVERWNAATGPVAATVIGRAARRVTRGSPEAPIGDLVADAMRAAAGVDIAFQNSGGLRAELPEGAVTRGGVYDVMPFDNTMTVETLTGAEVRKVLEEGLAYGRVTQVSGIRFSFDSSAPAGQRVKSLTLADGTPIDDAKDYRTVCNNFMATGGDNYETLSRGRDKHDDGALVRDAIERYVTAKSANGAALDVQADGRIQRVGGR